MTDQGIKAFPSTENTKEMPPPPGFILAKKSLLPGLSTSSSEPGNVGAGNKATPVADQVMASPSRRSGKEIVQELSTEEEKKAIVVNISRVRGAARSRFLAVGVFLSMLAITSKNVVESMRRVWRIRGHMESSQLADRRFILEFSKEGEFLHVTKGGPWSYREDAVLVDVLMEGQDPAMAQFTTVPIWTQFRKIPFYLLSKQLARRLGRKIGSFIYIDNNARGDICEKFIRARVHLPIDQALQRWITLLDEVTNEDVIVYVHYERMPTFCFICGFIGHTDMTCNIAGNVKRKTYRAELGIQPVHPEDERRWFLPEKVGQVRQQPMPALPWRSPPSTGNSTGGHNFAIVAHVANEVGKLSVNDKPAADNTDKNSDKKASKNANKVDINNNATEDLTKKPEAPTTTSPTPPALLAAEASDINKHKPGWKRIPRCSHEHKNGNTTSLTTQGGALGAQRIRPDMEEEDQNLQPMVKKILMHVPSLELCLGKENLAELRREEKSPITPDVAAAMAHPTEDNEVVEDTNSSSLDVLVESPVWVPNMYVVTENKTVSEKEKYDRAIGKKGEIDRQPRP
ncbi:hypothetical protein ACQ4PT_060444 [Festuca glaucescens]